MGDKYNDDFHLVLNGVNIARLNNGEEVTINNLGRSRTWLLFSNLEGSSVIVASRRIDISQYTLGVS